MHSGRGQVFARPVSAAFRAWRDLTDRVAAWKAARRYGSLVERIWAMAASVPDPVPAPEPRLSLVVPVRDTDPAFLDALLGSFRSQAPGLAEMILADDGSARTGTRAWLDVHADTPGLQVLRRGQPRGLAAAVNAGIEAARAPWIGRIDPGDLIAPHGVKMVVRALNVKPQTQFLYTDEVLAGSGPEARSLLLKPGFDPVLLSGGNYVNHLSVYRRDRLQAMGGFDPAFEGGEDYELVLRYGRGLAAHQIAHLPYPAYIWRQHGTHTPEARPDKAAQARRALVRHYAPQGRQTTAGPAVSGQPQDILPDLHRIDFTRPDADWPSVSVILPNRDRPTLVRVALEGILAKTDYPALELIVVDNGSADPETLALYAQYRSDPRVRVEIRPAPFNFSAMVNSGADLARGDHLLLLNNDIEVEEPGWLKEMVGCLDYPGTGIVGAKLLFPDRCIQHAGVILGLNDLAGHWFYKEPEHAPGPMNRLALRNSMTVVTAAVMLISGACWRAVGCFDTENFRVAYNDVDYCARARERGFGVVWTPHAQLIHHEAATRGRDDVKRNKNRFADEQAALRNRHSTEGFEDPVLSPWWSRYRSRPLEHHRDALPEPRHFMGFPAAKD